MWKVKLDWARIHQQPGQTVSKYYDHFIALKEVNETSKPIYMLTLVSQMSLLGSEALISMQ